MLKFPRSGVGVRGPGRLDGERSAPLVVQPSWFCNRPVPRRHTQWRRFRIVALLLGTRTERPGWLHLLLGRFVPRCCDAFGQCRERGRRCGTSRAAERSEAYPRAMDDDEPKVDMARTRLLAVGASLADVRRSLHRAARIQSSFSGELRALLFAVVDLDRRLTLELGKRQ